MAENFLSTQVDGTRIEASHVNQFKEAMTTDLVPRAVSGGATDEAGSLGTDIYRWLRGVISTLFTNKLSIGSTANESDNPTIEQSVNNVEYKVIANKGHNFYVGGVLKGKIDTDGVDGSLLKGLSVVNSKLAASSVTGAKIADSTITGSKIASQTIAGTKLLNDTITSTQLSADSVGLNQRKSSTFVSGTTSPKTINAGSYASVTSSSATARITVTNVSKPLVCAWTIESDGYAQAYPLGTSGIDTTKATRGFNSGVFIIDSNTTFEALRSTGTTLTFTVYTLN